MAGDSTLLSLGAGTLFSALLGTTEPSDLSAAWPSGWVDLGYTHEGSQMGVNFSIDPVLVAEKVGPVRFEITDRTIVVKFILAQNTASNMQRMHNGGLVSTGTGIVVFEPPEFSEITRRMYGFQSSDGQERVVWRRCLSAGSAEVERRKGATKTGIPMELYLEDPGGTTRQYKHIYSQARA